MILSRMHPTLGQNDSALFRFERGAPWLLIALGLLLLLPGTGTLPLLDRDEPRFAGATVEMIQRGEWIVPYFNDEYRFDKPVLTYWMMRAGYAVFGVGELGARIHSVVTALGVALVLWYAGRRWFSARAGFLAGAMWLCSVQVLIHGRLALADMPMVLCVAVAQVAWMELLSAGYTRTRFWALWLSLGLGFLAKGPIAWAVPLLSLLLQRWVFHRRPLPWGNLRIGRGLLVTLVLVGAWGIPALVSTQGLFWQKGMGEHVIQRGFEAFDGRRTVPFYYLPSSIFSLFPWIAFAGAAWRALRRDWSDRHAALVSWLLAPYIIFSIYSTQLPHYVLPAFPAFFLILAQAFARPDMTAAAGSVMGRAARVWAGVVFAAGFAVVCAGGVGLALARDLPPQAAPVTRMLWGVVALFSGLLLVPLLLSRRRMAWVGAAAGAMLIPAGLMLFAPALRAVHPAVKLAETCARMPPSARFVAGTFREPSLVFYGRHTWRFADSARELRTNFEGTHACLTITRESEYSGDKLFKQALANKMGHAVEFRAKSFSEENAELDGIAGTQTGWIEGVDVARGKWVRLRVTTRGEKAP